MKRLKIFIVAVIILFVNILIIGCCAPVKDMVHVKGGRYKSSYEDSKKSGPTDEVKIKDFYIGMYEVTQAQWKTVMEKNPSYFVGDSLPVESISWFSSVIFCNKLSEKEGLDKCYTIVEATIDSTNFNMDQGLKYKVSCDFDKNGYRLPTEAEWEYASLGGKKSKGYNYSGSDDINEVGWHIRNSGDKLLTEFKQVCYFYADSLKIYNNSTKAVGRKKPNELGIYDMSGNVYEYCWDSKDYVYINYEVELGDPVFGHEILVPVRIAIGGCWMYDILENSIADRMKLAPYHGTNCNGLRVARKYDSLF